jgi:hypothetical protein
MKAGDCVNTPHGVGTIVQFELHAPLAAGEAGPTFLDHVPADLPKGSYVRAGVSGTASSVKPVAYYSLVEFSPIPEP